MLIRHEIEELEDQHRQAEEVRQAEQESKERELEEKRQQLENMQREAELLKWEAQQVGSQGVMCNINTVLYYIVTDEAQGCVE